MEIARLEKVLLKKKSITNGTVDMFIMVSKGQKHKTIHRENEMEGTEHDILYSYRKSGIQTSEKKHT